MSSAPTGRRQRLPCPPYEGPARCPACAGARITGAVYSCTPLAVPELVVDVLCPICGGCGRATHDGCQPDEHGEWDHDDQDDDVDDTDACPSCRGRRWFPVQGWTDGDADMHTLRMPCGCATTLLVEVTW
ncbi:hypothetical protein ACGFI9_21835 [Micromonospora sp. NPDC048930]|uniref:hypothetical protein n=1 Tax=Micromonospora sp. NPDC048930 TaxID=3364261 RepID=UPI00371B3F19